MVTIIACSLFNIATLVALLAGLVVGFVQARGAIAEALAFDPPVDFRPWPPARGAAAPG